MGKAAMEAAAAAEAAGAATVQARHCIAVVGRGALRMANGMMRKEKWGNVWKARVVAGMMGASGHVFP